MGKKNRAKSSKKPTYKLPPKIRASLNEAANTILEKAVSDNSLANLNQQWDEFLEIHAYIKKIQELEKDIQCPEYERAQEFDGFMEWLKSEGAVVDGLEIADYGDGNFGFKCKKELKLNDPVIHIPKSILMSEATARKSSLKPLIEKDPLVKNMSNVSLAVHLLNELCDQNSFWLPYLRILPRTFSTVLYFTPEEIQKLKGSPAFEEALKSHRNIARQYGYLCKLCQSHPSAHTWAFTNHFSYNAYRWAVSCTMTRVNKVPSSDKKVNLALIPAWDMCNHEYGQFSTDFDEEKGILSCYSQRDYAVGEQFCIYYGRRSNTDFFISNGFVYRDNPEDSLKIHMGISKNDVNYETKADFLLDSGFPISGSFSIARAEHPFSQALLAVVAVICIKDKEELKKLTKQHLMEDPSKEVWKFLHTRLVLLLRNYRDLNLSPDASMAEHKIQSLFKEEKKILALAIEYINKKLD